MADERALDESALAKLRADVAAGKRPSLVLLSGGAGLPAGSRGQLVRIDDPPQDAEFLHVKVGNDELPFSPEELGLPGRRSKSAPAPAPAPAAAARAAAAKPTARSEPILEPVRPAPARSRSERVVEPPPAPATPTTAAPDPSSAERPADRSRAKRPGRTGGPPKVTLTLRFADFGWTVEALVAGRRDKPQPVPLAAIRAFADQLEDQSLRRALEGTVEACRSEAEKRASALRAELARLETELAALDD